MAGRNTVEIILSAADRASGTIRSTFGTLEQTSSRALSVVKAGAALAVSAMAAAGGYVAKLGVDYDAMAEQSKVAWTTLLGSQEKAKQMLQDIANFAKSTPFDTTSVDTMAKYMNNAGYAGKALFDQLMKISDVASAFNIPADSAQELARQMSQVVQAGVAYTEDLNVLGDRGVPIYQALAKELNTTVANVKQMASEGKITADVYMQAFSDIANGVQGASDAQSKTFTGLISTIKDDLDMLGGALAKPIFDKLKQGLSDLAPILDGVLAATKGDFKTFDDSINQVFGSSTGGKIISFVQGISDGFNTISDYAAKAKEAIKGIYDITTGNEGQGVSILDNLGFTVDAVSKIENVINTIRNTVIMFKNNIKSLFTGDNGWLDSFTKVFDTAKSIVMPILTDMVNFVKLEFAKIKQFWDENGAQIIQAIKNFWAIITTIFQVLAPVVLFILKMLWDNVKGVIDGALNVIMGVIKVFAGLFTGDFSKMWEGIKQLFSGAIELVWNLINLLMFGRILGGIKAFVLKSGEFFAELGPKFIDIVKNLDSYLWNFISSMFSKLVSIFKGFVDQGAQIFGTLRTFGASIFESLWAAIRSVAGNIASGVTGFFRDMFTGAKFHLDGLLNAAKNIFNAVKDAITNPIDTAKTLVGKAIEGIKGLFSGISNIKIPLPHLVFKSGSINPMDWGDAKKRPSFDVSWYDKGGVFYGPQIIGVGEKRPEFVGALDDLRKIVREETGGGKSGNVYHITVDKEDTAEDVIRVLRREEWLHGQ